MSALGDLFATLFENVGTILEKIGSIFEWLGNFFSNLVEFFIHIFVPTEEQWDEIKNTYRDLIITIEGHIPFLSFIKSTFTDIPNTVINEHDFLLIEMPSFSFFGGQTEETIYFNVRDAYEPRRLEIRSFLLLLVYGAAFVYIVKVVTDYGATQYANAGLENMSAGNRLGRGKGD